MVSIFHQKCTSTIRSIRFRVLFEKKYLSTRWDAFHCFDRQIGAGDETENLGSAGAAVKTYRATDERNGPLLEGTPENRPIRKPDPDLRTLRRQISFGSTTGFGSLRKKPTGAEHEAGLLSPPPGKSLYPIRSVYTSCPATVY